jgi:hypothetical protein
MVKSKCWWALMGSIGKITPTSKRYHMHVESCLEYCMHMSLCEMSPSWLCEIMWSMWMFVEMCTWLCLSFGDTCTFMMMVMKWKWWEHILVISFNDDCFGDDDEVWIICTWLGDDDFLVYTLDMMTVFVWDN